MEQRAAGPDEQPWAHHEAVVNGIRLHWVEAGTGPLVLLLHGFPEFWYGWRRQIPALAAEGFRVVAPDLRGYGLSGKPRRVRSYDAELVGDDLVALVAHLGEDRANIVGHDWGGYIAFLLAMHHPAVVDKLAVLNGPHPAAVAREMRKTEQLARSAYMFFFQLPWIPELVLRSRDHAAIRAVFERDPVSPGAFSAADIDRYVEAIARPGALTAALNYYRAAGRRVPLRGGPRVRRIHAPTLLVWGERDRYLGRGFTRGLESWIPRLRIERIAEASHWVQHDAPARVNELLSEFLLSYDTGGGDL